MVNQPKAKKLIEQLQTALRKLRQLAAYSPDEFLRDFMKTDSAKYLLLVAIESCIDLGNHIISSENYRAPEDYSDVFKVLLENKILSDDFTVTMQKMVKFRNRIVHLYWDVEETALHGILKNNLEDFDEFLKNISKLF
jgi:uncharacterized protein YutE (UPF0331/DUF86 family)